MKDETLYDVLYDYQTRLQGVSNGLGAKLREIMRATEEDFFSVLKRAPRFVRDQKTANDRINNLVQKLEETLAPLYDAAQELIVSTCVTVVENATKETALEISIILAELQRELPEGRIINALTRKQRKAVVEEQEIVGATIREWFCRWKREGLKKLSALVRRSWVLSTNPSEIDEAAFEATEVDFVDGVFFAGIISSALRLAHKLVNGVSNNARIETICQNTDFIDSVKFIGMLDGTKQRSCAAYNGQIWRKEEMKTAPRPPLHPNCCCTLIPWIERKESEEARFEDDEARLFANANNDKFEEDAYNAESRAKGWNRLRIDLSPTSKQNYSREAQVELSSVQQFSGPTTFRQYFSKQPDDFKLSWLGADRFELFKSASLDDKDLFTPISTYTVEPDSLISFPQRAEAERLAEISRDYHLVGPAHVWIEPDFMGVRLDALDEFAKKLKGLSSEEFKRLFEEFEAAEKDFMERIKNAEPRREDYTEE